MRIRSVVVTIVVALTAIVGSATPTFGQTFTDEPLTAGTPIKAVHVTELRTAVANLRALFGLPIFPFSDPTLLPGVTQSRAIHLTELRSALDDVYDAAVRSRPSYTDPTLTGLAIKAVHIQELRTATLNAFNRPPSFTKGADQTVNEDAGAQTIVAWATGISPGSGEPGQTVTLVIDTNDNGGLFAAGPSVASNGTLTYRPAANQQGAAHITLHAHDNGGTVNGGVDNSATQAFTITVDGVNDAPGFTKGADQTVLEDSGPQTVTTWATGISAGPASESGQTVAFNITGNTNAALFSVQPAVALNGTLTYTLVANAFGSASIALVAVDNGGTANGGVDTSASQTFAINVTSVNDAPSFTKGANQTVNEDAGPQTVVGWATAISIGPANEAGQTVNFVIDTNDNTGLFSAGPAVAANGALTYTPATNQNGVANITLHIHDNGGTANGGVDASATQSFTITVNAVNDAPTVTNKAFGPNAVQANLKMIGLTGLLSGVTDVDSGVNGCSPTFTVTNVSATTPTGGTLTVTNASTGTFDFEPPPGATGDVTFTYTVQDNGCPGIATSAAATVTVNVAGPVIWFVDSTAPGGGNGTWTGTNAKAFQTVAQAAAVDASDHRVFVLNNNVASINYANGIALNPGGWLVGQGATGSSFDSLMGITPPAGTVSRPSINGVRPTLQGTVTVNTKTGTNVVNLLGFNLSTGASTALTNAGVTINGVTINLGSVATTTGTAVSITGTSNGTVTANAMTFFSVSANGAANGIVLNNATGSFTVAGDGTNNASGGTIQNATNNGVTLSSAQNVSLTSMSIQNTAHYGVSGTSVSNFSFINGTINNSGTGLVAQDSNIGFNMPASGATNISGTLTVTGSTLTNSFYHGVTVRQDAGTISNLTISNNTFTSSTVAANSNGSAIDIDPTGSAGGAAIVVKGTIDGNIINNFPSGAGIQMLGGNTASAVAPLSVIGCADATATACQPLNAANKITISNNLIAGQSLANGMGTNGIAVQVNGHSQENIEILNNGTVANPIKFFKGNGILFGCTGPSKCVGKINNNIMDGSANIVASPGISIGTDNTFGTSDAPSLTLEININTVSQSDGNGILATARSATGHANYTIMNNNIGAPRSGVRPGIRVDAGNASSIDDSVCLAISGNTSAGSGGTQGIGLRKQGTTSTTNDFSIVGMSATSTPGIETYVNGLNPAANGTLLISATSGFSACTIP